MPAGFHVSEEYAKKILEELRNQEAKLVRDIKNGHNPAQVLNEINDLYEHDSSFVPDLVIEDEVFDSGVLIPGCDLRYNILFNNCNFNAGITIQQLDLPNLTFTNCTFLGVWIYQAKGQISFDQCKEIYLLEVRGELPALGRGVSISVSKTAIKKFACEQATLHGLQLVNLKVEEFRADNSKLVGFTVFENVTFTKPPYFFGAQVLNALTFRICNFPTDDGRYWHHYRQLKFIMDQAKNEVEETVFGALELECRHHLLNGRQDALEKLVSIVYKRINNYGRSLNGPLKWICIQFIIFSIVHLVLSCTGLIAWTMTDKTLPVKFSLLAISMWTAAVGALGPARLFGSFHVLYEPNDLLSMILLWTETILSSVLWYLFIAGVRKRFRTT